LMLPASARSVHVQVRRRPAVVRVTGTSPGDSPAAVVGPHHDSSDTAAGHQSSLSRRHRPSRRPATVTMTGLRRRPSQAGSWPASSSRRQSRSEVRAHRHHRRPGQPSSSARRIVAGQPGRHPSRSAVVTGRGRMEGQRERKGEEGRGGTPRGGPRERPVEINRLGLVTRMCIVRRPAGLRARRPAQPPPSPLGDAPGGRRPSRGRRPDIRANADFQPGRREKAAAQRLGLPARPGAALAQAGPARQRVRLGGSAD
jgi:hypothetical protein